MPVKNAKPIHFVIGLPLWARTRFEVIRIEYTASAARSYARKFQKAQQGRWRHVQVMTIVPATHQQGDGNDG